MSEREKMVGGDLYVATDPELVAARARARAQTARDNAEPDPARETVLVGTGGVRVTREPPAARADDPLARLEVEPSAGIDRGRARDG